jgi:hypothetical protein
MGTLIISSYMYVSPLPRSAFEHDVDDFAIIDRLRWTRSLLLLVSLSRAIQYPGPVDWQYQEWCRRRLTARRVTTKACQCCQCPRCGARYCFELERPMGTQCIAVGVRIALLGCSLAARVKPQARIEGCLQWPSSNMSLLTVSLALSQSSGVTTQAKEPPNVM